MWRKFQAWMTLNAVEQQRFDHRWEFTDKIFKVAEWTIVVGIMGGVAASLFTRKDTWRGWLVALVVAGLVFRLLYIFSAWNAGWLDTRYPPGQKRSFAQITPLVIVIALVALVAFEVGHAIFEVQAATYLHT